MGLVLGKCLLLITQGWGQGPKLALSLQACHMQFACEAAALPLTVLSSYYC